MWPFKKDRRQVQVAEIRECVQQLQAYLNDIRMMEPFKYTSEPIRIAYDKAISGAESTAEWYVKLLHDYGLISR